MPELTLRLRRRHRRAEPHRYLRSRAGAGNPCPACGESVRLDAHAVRYRGEAYHANCALYRRGEL